MSDIFSNITAKRCSIHVARNGACLADQAEIARTMNQRMVGLLGRKTLEKGDGLVLLACSSIHMAFMQFSIDALFIDHNASVIRIYHDLGIWRMTPMIWKAKTVIELPAGTASEAKVQVGDELIFENCKQS